MTLSPGLVEAIARICPDEACRSEFLERAAWNEIGRAGRAERDARDRAIYDTLADEMNADAEASLELQAAIPFRWPGDEFTADDLASPPQ